MNKLFEEVHIRTIKDLPTEDGEYFVNRSGFKFTFSFEKGKNEMMWMKEIRYYLKELKNKGLG
jgi:hypothetical protein